MSISLSAKDIAQKINTKDIVEIMIEFNKLQNKKEDIDFIHISKMARQEANDRKYKDIVESGDFFYYIADACNNADNKIIRNKPFDNILILADLINKKTYKKTKLFSTLLHKSHLDTDSLSSFPYKYNLNIQIIQEEIWHELYQQFKVTYADIKTNVFSDEQL